MIMSTGAHGACSAEVFPPMCMNACLKQSETPTGSAWLKQVLLSTLHVADFRVHVCAC